MPLKEMAEATPPHSLEMERNVLGSMILDPTAIDVASGRLRASDFYQSVHGDAYEAMLTIHDLGEPIDDAKILVERFKAFGISKAKGKSGDGNGITVADIATWVNDTGSPSSIEYYVREVVRHSRHRRLIRLTLKTAGDLQNPACDLDAVIDHMVSQAIQSQAGADVALTTLKEACQAAYERIADSVRKGTGTGLMTGLNCLDETMGGLCNAEMIILAARPGEGKTALGMQVATQLAREGTGVLFVSLEMKDHELAARLLHGYADVSARSIRNGSVTEGQLEQLQRVASELDWPVVFYAPKGERVTVRHVAAATRIAAARSSIGAVVIDYVQILRGDDPRKPRHEQLEEIAEGIKTKIAREFNLPVLLLCQLNRDSSGKVPRLSDLKGSGALEQDADSVIAIHDPGEDENLRELLILKNRHGAEGKFKVCWNARATRFYDYEPLLAD